MPWKTCRLCTQESSKNLILLSIFYSITFTLAWVIVSLLKYYAYCSRDYQFSVSPYVIAFVNLRNCVRPIVVFSKCKKILFHPRKSVVVFAVPASSLVSMVVFLRRNFSICCTINFFFPNVFQFAFI